MSARSLNLILEGSWQRSRVTVTVGGIAFRHHYHGAWIYQPGWDVGMVTSERFIFLDAYGCRVATWTR